MKPSLVHLAIPTFRLLGSTLCLLGEMFHCDGFVYFILFYISIGACGGD
jgi:hypothetical protein